MTKVAIIGAGKGGRALLEMFAGDPTVTILGVVDVNPWAPGLELARRLNIPVATDLRGLIADPRLDLVIDVTGSPEVQRAILELKPAATEVMGGASARFMWDLLAERKRSEELEDRYSIMLRELQAQAEGDFIIGQKHHALRRPCRQVLGVERHARAPEERGAGPVDARADEAGPPDREPPRHGSGCPFPGAGEALHSRHGRASQGLGWLQRGQRPLRAAALTAGGRARPE
jgi:hypothetical protein